MSLFKSIMYPYEGNIKYAPKAVVRYLIDPEYKINVLARRILESSGFKARRLSYRMLRKHGVYFSATATGGEGLYLAHATGVVIPGTQIGKNCTIFQNVTIGQCKNKYPIIGDNVFIYAGAVITGGIHVGNNSIIGANSVVTKDVPPYSVVAGAPARVIKTLTPEEYLEYC